jgi:hypothetical protein
MTAKLVDANGQETDKFDNSFNRVLIRYQGVLLASLSSLVLFFLVQIYFKLDKVLVDNERFNTYTILNEHRWANTEKMLADLKVEMKELHQEIKENDRQDKIHERESSQRWSEVLRDKEFSRRER